VSINKILYVARKAKGFSQLQLAKLMQMDETAYQELEYSLDDISGEQAKKLSKLFDVEPEHFLFNERQVTRVLKVAMDEVTAILEATKNDLLPPANYFSMIKLGNKALMLQAELNHEMYRRYQLEEDIAAIKSMYLKLKEETSGEK
jgi:transcriptional regulator with XRE-family HTH domain